MDAWNAGRNRWRYKEGSDEKIIEIELTQGKVALTDADRLEEVQQHKWSTRNSYKETYYAKTTFKKDDGTNLTIDMHKYLFPDLEAPRDHIDRDGLNNTRINLRCGAGGINRRNSRSDKPDKGIKTKEKAYVANWSDSLGKVHSKRFAWSKYSSVQEAYKAAVVWRTKNDEVAIEEITQAREQKRPIESTAPTPRQRKDGPHYENICILYKKERFYRLKASIRVNGKRLSKHFSAYQFNDNLDNAIAAANEWLCLMQDERQKKRKIEPENDN
jgi:hypothetical protein